jgi:hypothetical protein
MKHALLISFILLVAACNRQEQAAAPAPNAVAEKPAAPIAKAPVPSIDGRWNVATVDGNQGVGLTLTLTDGKATMAAGCLRRGFTYKQDRNQVVFTSDPSGSANCGNPPSAAQETAFAALADANTAIFGKDGKTVTLSGYGGIVSLERR